MVYQRIPCAIQPDPVVYLYYIQEFASANPELPIHPEKLNPLNHIYHRTQITRLHDVLVFKKTQTQKQAQFKYHLF